MSARPEPLLFQQMTRCHSVFSCFSPLCEFHCRLVATDRVATRDPLFVLRTSGSAPRFPMIMTLLRLRLTATSDDYAGSGAQGCPTVYESQVILSIKDTPLVAKLRITSVCWNGSSQDDRILDRTPVISRPASHFLEPERRVQGAGRAVRIAHFQEDAACAAFGDRR